MSVIYNIGIYAYRVGAAVAALQSVKVRQMLRGQTHTLGALEGQRRAVAPDGYDLWVHAASLGEFEQARPLIERVRAERPEMMVLLTFFSPSGYNVRHSWPGAHTVAYLPFDTPRSVREFLDAARPRMAVFVKYEFWGNYLAELHRREIPTYIISAIFRPGQIFFKPWGGIFRQMLQRFDHLYVQDAASKRLLASIGVENVTVAGDTRFDRVATITQTAPRAEVVERFVAGAPFVLVAGSSWAPDEALYIPWLKTHPAVRAVIAPHEFDAERLNALKAKLGPGARLLSEVKSPGDLKGDETALIIDCFGLLSGLYRYGTAAWVGGGFGAGIHNINEAAAWGIPVIFGPRHQKFREAAGLIAAGAGCSVSDAKSAQEALNTLCDNPDECKKSGEAAAEYIRQNLGATDKIFNTIIK